ncbi:MAG: DUF2497 domain-containing protein [Rickettsiales bacterium]|nr:DUF2497 domain-containing protein [Rickettsiales bacterium]
MSKTTDVDSIDQILEKIKKTINEDIKKTQSPLPSSNEVCEDQEILELTNVVTSSSTLEDNNLEDIIEKKNFDPIAKHIKKFTHRLNTLTKNTHNISEKEIREIFKETLRPYLKSWLNNNLEGIVKEVLEVEIKKILKKII